MKFPKKILILLLIFSLLNLYLPRLSFSQVGFIEPKVTEHPPEMRSSLAENIPVEEVTKKQTGWVWWVLGLVVVVGAVTVAAVGAGGGGGGSSSNSSSSSSSGGNSGGLGVGW